MTTLNCHGSQTDGAIALKNSILTEAGIKIFSSEFDLSRPYTFEKIIFVVFFSSFFSNFNFTIARATSQSMQFASFRVVYSVQSTLVISTSVISNNRLSRRENLILVLT